MDKFRSELAAWTAIYQKYFGIKPEWPEVNLDKYDPDKYFLIAVASGITMNAVLDVMDNKFVTFPLFNDLDRNVTSHERVPDDNYLVLAARNIESDPELTCISTADLDRTLGFNGITLLERMLLELYYFEETGDHLDRDCVNLCSGSRDFDGDVPSVSFTDIGFVIDCYEPDDYDFHLIFRKIYLPEGKASV